VPAFHLHLCNGVGFLDDEEGQIFPDLESARQGAVTALREIAGEEIARGKLYLGSFIEIEDANRRHLDTVRFADAVEILETECRPPRSG
jgi:hypothetical protein